LKAKFNVDINPFGTLYNPLSIAQSWERIVEGKAIIENELFAFNNLWHSYDHHSRFSGCDKKATLSLMNLAAISLCFRQSTTPATKFVADGRYIRDYRENLWPF